MIKCLKLLWGNSPKMDSFLMNAFCENLVRVYSAPLCQPKLRIFILSIWKKATSDYQVMIKHLKKTRAIIMCCLQIKNLSKDNVLSTRDLWKDFIMYRYAIVLNLSSEHLNIFSRWEFDKYQIAGLVVDYLNRVPCSPAEIKAIMDRFRLAGLDMARKDFVSLFQTVRTNAAFNFLWIVFWIGAEVA